MSTEVQAKLNFLRMGPRKVRLLADLIRSKKASEAVNILTLVNKKAARPLLNLLNSAIANAKHNFSLPVDSLVVARITVDGGPVLKRWMPRARGRATPIRERTSHIKLVLSSNEKSAKKAAQVQQVQVAPEDNKKEDKKEETVATKQA